jgi:hypothetical protein
MDDIFDGPEPIIVDRSTLELYATCPAQGNAVLNNEVITSSKEADSGAEVHDVIAAATAMVAMEGTSLRDLATFMHDAIEHSRPDVQPDAIDGLKASIYPICRNLLFLPSGDERNPADLLKYDGGEGMRSSQTSFDIDEWQGRPIRLTSEIDLLMAAQSEEELECIDYKSGRKYWTAAQVRASFQFGAFHPWLLFCNYPRAQRIHIRVHMTRFNALTGRVTFDRGKHFTKCQGRLESSLKYFKDHWLGNEAAPTWPEEAKCSMCPAASVCPAARNPVKKFVEDKKEYLESYVAMEAKLKEMATVLSAYTKEYGDLVYPNVAAGREKPKYKPTSPRFAVYTPASTEEEEATAGDAV